MKELPFILLAIFMLPALFYALKYVVRKNAKKKEQPKLKPTHIHDWELQYRTGNAFDGKTDVCKCKCGTWAIRHFGQKDYIVVRHDEP